MIFSTSLVLSPAIRHHHSFRRQRSVYPTSATPRPASSFPMTYFLHYAPNTEGLVIMGPCQLVLGH
jgi:hypothetical protein